MLSIVKDFSLLTPFLEGRRFDENMSIDYSIGGDVGFRNDVLVDLCRGKRVLHVGCCDHVPLIAQKIEKGEWLHGQITDCSALTVGIDIDGAAVEEAKRISSLTNIVAGDITSGTIIEQIADQHFDIALFGEVVEHISNPVHFLSRFRTVYGGNFDDIVVTVPNAFRGGNVRGILRNKEVINSDHRFFFTPYTIAKVATDAGFKPKEIMMASFTRSSRAKQLLLARKPLLAEDIIFIGSQS